MARRATNNPRQIRSQSCGCRPCFEKYPPETHGERKKRRDCLGSWQARYRDADGRQRHKNFRTKKEADAFLDQVRTEVRSGTYIDPARGDITVEQWWATWWPAHEPTRATTRNRKLSSWNAHICPKWGKRKLNSLTYLEVQTWMAKEVKGYATQTKVLELLRAMLKAAVRDRRILINPAEDVTKTASPPAKHPDDLRPPTPEQYEAVRAELPPWYRAHADFLEDSGLRWGEMTGLRAVHLDLEADVIKVREVVIDDKGTLRRQGIPKSAAGFRTVPLTPKAKDAALILIDRLQPAATQTDVDDGMHPEEIVFRGPLAGTSRRASGKAVLLGGVLSRNNFRRLWIPAIKEAGIARMVKNAETGRKEWWPRVSDYRDAYASRLHAEGMSEAEVQYVLGHERGGKVTWMYTHRGEDAVENARKALAGERPSHLRAVS